MSGTLATRAADAKSDRLIAYLLDFTLLSVAVFALWVVSFVVNAVVTVGAISGAAATASSAAESGSLIAASLLGMAINAALWLAIGALLAWYFVSYADDGRTFGKRSQDVAVVDGDGGVPSRRQRLIRTGVLLAPYPLMALLGAVLGLVGFVVALFLMVGWLLVEALVLLVSDDGRRLGDRAAGTHVVVDA